jgi:hypothetical protein
LAKASITAATGRSAAAAPAVSTAQSTGAAVLPHYHDTTIAVVGVPVEDLRDFSDSSKEEFGQYTLGQFLASGGFWLAIERAVTVGFSDHLFWISLIALVAGLGLSYAAFRQLRRRKTRIETYITRAEKNSNGV